MAEDPRSFAPLEPAPPVAVEQAAPSVADAATVQQRTRPQPATQARQAARRAGANGGTSQARTLEDLQRAAGNRAVSRMMTQSPTGIPLPPALTRAPEEEAVEAPETTQEAEATEPAEAAPPAPEAAEEAGTAEVQAEAAPARAATEGTPRPTPEGTQAAEGEPAAPEGRAEEGEAGAEAEAVPEPEREPPAPPSPRDAIAPAASAVGRRASAMRQHPPAAAPVRAAQAAAIEPETEQSRGAAAQTVANLDEAEAREIQRQQFKQALQDAIRAATPEPETEEEAEQVMETGATQASAALGQELATQRDTAAAPMRSAAEHEVPPSERPAPPETELQPEQVGSPPAPVSAAPVVPEPLPPERLDYSSDSAQTEQLMADNDVTPEQIERGNEPAFRPAVETRTAAEEHEASAEPRYRQAEAEVRNETEGTAQQTLTQGLTGFYGEREMRIGQEVAEQQTATESRDAAERRRITAEITVIKDRTQEDVNEILDSMETEASDVFADGLERAEEAYEDAFEEAKGGLGTWLTTWGEDWERHIEESLATARQRYLDEVDSAIDEVANLVGDKLAEAKQRVADGRQEVQDYVDGLDESVRSFGEEAMEAVSADFDAMETQIDERRDALVNSLTQQYRESYERMSAMEERLRQENQSLWQRVYNATVGVIQKIIEFKDMLLGILARAANVVSDIIDDPIGFLGNLITGIKMGLDNFVANIAQHLQQALMEWLFGTLAEAGIQLPERFDLQGILNLVLQILGLTYDNIRQRAVNILGEELVSRLEQVAEIFKILITEGPGGLWAYIKEKLGDLKVMVIDEIKAFVIEKIVIAGIKWVIGLLNPAAAFIKACMAIYDIIKFFIERGSQIIALINAIIDSLGAIVSGNLSGAAQLVEDALARALPVVIGFLASLLGLGGISEKIRSIIEKIRRPINAAIDWVIQKAVKMVKAAGRLLGIGREGPAPEEEVAETDDPEHDARVEAGLAAINSIEQRYTTNGRISREDAETVAETVEEQHPVFTSLSVVDGGDRWDYAWAASDGSEHETPAMKLESKSVFEGRNIEDAGIIDELVTAGYRRPYQRAGKWIIARKQADSGLERLSVDENGIIKTGPSEDESDRGEIIIDISAIRASLDPHPHLWLFRFNPLERALRLRSSLRREALSEFRPRSTAQMQRELLDLLYSEESLPTEVPVGGATELEEVEQTGTLPRSATGSGLRRSAMSEVLIDQFVDLFSTDGWPSGWEVHHVLPTDWGGTDDVSNYAAIPGSLHQDITNWWNRLRAQILRDAEAQAALAEGTTAEFRAIKFE